MNDKIIHKEHEIHYLSSRLVFNPKDKVLNRKLKAAKKQLLNLKYS